MTKKERKMVFGKLKRKILDWKDSGSRELLHKLGERGVDSLDYWAPGVNPRVTGMERVKKAILLSLASLGDKYGDRRRIHVLIEGEPGTAKSELIRWVENKLGAHSTGPRTTEVGLTGSASGKEIEPGELVKAHGGTLVIDEFDKFDSNDRKGALTSMSDGIVKIRAGGKSADFKAETRIIAVANDASGFSPSLLDRFDFHFFIERPSREKEKEIISSKVRKVGEI